MFAIENAFQSKNQFLRDAVGKSYLLRHLTITITHQNLILEIGHTYAKKHSLQIFFQR